MRLSIAAVCVCVLWSASAFAQADDPAAPPPPAPSEPPPPPPPPAPPGYAPVMMPPPPPMDAPPRVSTVDKGTLEDANSGRVAIMPTALTPPAGTWSFEDWELFLISASYAPTDNLVITATTMVPVTSDAYWGFVSGKLQVARSGNVRLAVQGGLAGVWAKSSTTYDSMGNVVSSSSDSTSGLELGAAVTYCFDADCYSHASAAALAGFAHQTNSSVPVGFMGGVVARLGKRVRFIAEADTAHLFGKLNDQADGFLGWYGVRFTSKQIGVDLALVKPFCSGCSSSTFPLGFPFVTFSYRAIE